MVLLTHSHIYANYKGVLGMNNSKEIKEMVNKMLDDNYSDYEIAKFITNNYFLKSHDLSDFEDDLIFTYNLTETAAENLVDKIKEIFSKDNQGKEIIQKCNRCNTIFKIIVIESDVREPLGYTASCPACGANGIYEIEEVK